MAEPKELATARRLTRGEIYGTWNSAPPEEWTTRVEAVIRKFCEVNGITLGNEQPTDKVTLPDRARPGVEVLHRITEALCTTDRYEDRTGAEALALYGLLSCIAEPEFRLPPQDDPVQRVAQYMRRFAGLTDDQAAKAATVALTLFAGQEERRTQETPRG